MTTVTRGYWNLIWKCLIAIGIWCIVWNFAPNIAALMGTIAGLCIIAAVLKNSPTGIANRDFTADFNQRLALVEANRSGAGLNQTQTTAFLSAVASQPFRANSEMTPMRGPNRIERAQNGFSIKEVVRDSAIIVGAAELFHAIHLPIGAAMAFLLLAILSVARMSGWLTNIFASIAGTIAVAILFLPPVGSLRVAQPFDQVLLMLFFLLSIVSFPLIYSGPTVKPTNPI